MQERMLISTREFCSHHQIEFSFIHSLQDYGLIQGQPEEEDYLLSPDQLETLERLVRLHYDLHINFEGIDVVHNLLQRLGTLQNEIQSLRNRLRLYEQDV